MCLCAGQKMQDMDERRIRRLAEGYCQFSDIEKKVLPIISKCLEGITTAGKKIDEKQVNVGLSNSNILYNAALTEALKCKQPAGLGTISDFNKVP